MKLFFDYVGSIIQEKQKKRIVILIVMMTVSAVLEVFSVSSVIPVLSAIVDKDFWKNNYYAQIVCEKLSVNTYNGFVLLCVCVLIVSFVLKNVFLIWKNAYHARFSLEFQHELRIRVLTIYFNKEYEYFLNANSSNIIATLFDDIGKCYATFDGIISILTDFIMLLALSITIFTLEWKLSLGILIVLSIVFSVVTFFVRPIVRQSGIIAHAALVKRDKWIKQGIWGIKTVKSTDSYDYFINKSNEADIEFSKEEEKSIVLSKIPRNLIEMISIITILCLITYRVIEGKDINELLPVLGAMGLAVLRILPAVSSMLSNVSSIQYRMHALERIAKIVRKEKRIEHAGEFPDRYRNSIKFHNISFSYLGSDRLVLDGLSQEIPIGSMVGIVGTSGEGKTTLVDIMIGLLKPNTGTIEVDGVNIYQNLTQWKKSIGYITQNTFLLDDSIISNVAFGVNDTDVDEEKIWDALEKAQISDYIRSLPEGIYTKIGERGIKLSGGQRQRIGIARALYSSPQILIFDEATSSLDSETEKAVVEAINELYGKQTMIVIAHRSKALEKCDIVFRLENGQLKQSIMAENTYDGVLQGIL